MRPGAAQTLCTTPPLSEILQIHPQLAAAAPGP